LIKLSSQGRSLEDFDLLLNVCSGNNRKAKGKAKARGRKNIGGKEVTKRFIYQYKNNDKKPETLDIGYRKEYITPHILIIIINANAEKIRAERDKRGREMRKIGRKRGREKKMEGMKKELELFISEKIEKFIFPLSFNVYLCFKSR